MESRGCAALWVLLLAQVSEQQTPACALGRAAAASGSPGDPQPPPFSGSSWLETGEYDLVSAYEVDHRGDYVSHDIMHYQRRRRRRAVTQPGGDALHLRLKGPRHDLHLDLKAASNLMAPGFMVQTLGKGGTKSVQMFPPEENCFYQGSLRSQGNSSVALSTCQGLLGMIRTKDTDYFLKPLPPHLTSKLNRSAQGDSPSHVLYKRSTERQVPRENHVLMITRKRDLARPHLHHDNFHLGPSQKQHFCGRRKKYMPQPPNDDLYILPDEYKPSSRHKRSLLKSHRNEELNVETLVVVDRKMMQSHGHENITTYVLTILNMVSALFKDGTIGGNINIVIVGLILLEDEQVFQLPKQRLFPLEENDCEKLLLVLMQSLCVLFISLLLGKRKISYFVFKMTHLFSFLMVVW